MKNSVSWKLKLGFSFVFIASFLAFGASEISLLVLAEKKKENYFGSVEEILVLDKTLMT